MSQEDEFRSAAENFAGRLEAYGLTRDVLVEDRRDEEWELPGWWARVARWRGGRPKIGLWRSTSSAPGPLWFGFCGSRRQIQTLAEGPWSSIPQQSKKIDIDFFTDPTRLSGGFVKEFDEDTAYFGLYEFALASRSAGTVAMIGEAVRRLVDLIEMVDGNQEERDLRKLENDRGLSPTEKTQLIMARRGQGEFRRRLQVRWGGCAVTGCTTTRALRASHIQPWCKSNNTERLDEQNGLLLVATLDALFDRGLISFDKNGQIVISNEIDGDERIRLGLDARMRLRKPLAARQNEYLAAHREAFGL